MLVVIHQHMLNDTPTSTMTVPRLTIKGQKGGSGPIPGNPRPFPEIVGIILPLISLWNYPAHKNYPLHILGPLAFWDGPHSVCGMCIFLNKSTSYLSLCLSLNSFCDKTSRTWASLSPETRCVISIKRQWVQVPIWVVWFHYDHDVFIMHIK